MPYTYKVRIVNPNKKSDFIVRQLHRCHSKFTSVTAVRVSLIEQFDEQVPESVKFNVGYIDGRHQMSLFSNEDLNLMYSKYKFGGEIILWCDGRCREESRSSRKRDIDTSLLKRQEREDQIDGIFKDLKSKHRDKYSVPQLRLWSRMICTGIHDDMDKPPNIPAFGGSTKKPRKESVADAITGAATTVIKALCTPVVNNSGDSKASAEPESHRTPITGISPGKAVELRMKNLEQLRYLQNVFEDGILDEKEYAEQKNSILTSLRKL